MTMQYQHAVIATDIVIFTIIDNDLKVLLIKMKKSPFEDSWAMPGGLIEPDESLEKAAYRHLLKKTNVKDVYLEQLYTFGDVDRDPFGRVVSVAYFALISADNLKLKTTKEYTDVKWFSIKEIPKLAYDHEKILEHSLKRLKSKLEYTNIVQNLLPKQFTLKNMQDIYELILNKKIDKRNFRKKISSLKIIKKTDKKTTGEAHRPADLYEFSDKNYKIIQIL
jgi:8-oxo-dGTP diphosphatase